MSWYRRIKSLFTIEFVIFAYLIYLVFEIVFMNRKTNILIFFNLLIAVFTMQYFIDKKKNLNLSLILGLVFALPINIILFKNKLIIIMINCLYVFLIMSFGYKIEKTYIDYESSKQLFEQSVIVMIAIWLISMFFNFQAGRFFLRFYIIYLGIGIIYLRQIRNYTYNLVNKKSSKIDFTIICVFISLCIDKVFNIFLKLIGLIASALDFLINNFINLLMFILKPFNGFFIKLSIFFKSRKGFEVVKRKKAKYKLPKNKVVKQGYMIIIIKTILKIAFVMLIVFIIYKIIKSLVSYKPSQKENSNIIREEKEKIEVDNELKDSKIGLRDIIKNMYMNKDAKSKIQFIYKMLEKKSKDKELFHEYMTASQLKNSIDINRDVNKEDIEYITKKYNETKFSTHDINIYDANEFKDKYENINKKI